MYWNQSYELEFIAVWHFLFQVKSIGIWKSKKSAFVGGIRKWKDAFISGIRNLFYLFMYLIYSELY